MDDFKLDAFGLNSPFEGSVAAVDAEFEVLLKLRVVGVLHSGGLVPLGLLLNMDYVRKTFLS